MFNFDLRDDKGGYHGHPIFEDEDIYVTLAVLVDRPRRKLIDVTFKKLAIHVLTFDLADLAVELMKNSDKKEEFVNSVIGLIKMDFATLSSFVEACRKYGFDEGQYELKATIRGLLGVEECTH